MMATYYRLIVDKERMKDLVIADPARPTVRRAREAIPLDDRPGAGMLIDPGLLYTTRWENSTWHRK